MALPRVSVELKNGGLGLVAPSDDAVVGLVMNSVGFNNLPLLQPKQLFSREEFDDWCKTLNATGAYVVEARRQINDFYKVAGSGAELWVMFVDPLAPLQNLLADGQMLHLLLASEGRIRVMAITRFLDVEPTTPLLMGGLDADVMNALDEAHALAVSYANQNLPFRILLEGKYFAGEPAPLLNLKTFSYNRVGVCIARTDPARATVGMGMLLGRVASIPVNRSIGRVKDGPMPIEEAYLGTDNVRTINVGRQGAIHDKGYIFLRKHNGKGGVFFNADPMATSDVDDYNRLARGRVIDKAHRIAYAVFLEELLDEVLVDETTGKILATTIKQYQARIERAIDKQMTANNEISGVSAFIDPAQDILGTNTLYVDLRIVPTGSNEYIKISLGLSNPQAAI